MIKIFGIILTSMTICVYGFYYSYKETFRQRDLQQLKKALTIFLSEIKFSLSTIETASKNISEKTSHPINKIFFTFNENLKKNSNDDLSIIWKDSVEKNLLYTYFEEEDIGEIISFGKTLGYLDDNQQVININLLLDYVNNTINEIELKKNQNKKLYQSLSVLASLLFIVILI